MKSLSGALKVLSVLFFIAGAMHLALGLRADQLLGAGLPPEVLSNATLDSQNRFYGVAFTLNGALLWFCSYNIAKYAAILQLLLWVIFAAGSARLISIALYGLPSPAVTGLMLTEILAPVPLSIWIKRVAR